MLLESSQLGADIDLHAIPKPDTVSWQQWLTSFPSFGYLLTTDADKVDQLLALFHQRDLTANVIGTLNGSGQCSVRADADSALFWDINPTPLTAMRKPHA